MEGFVLFIIKAFFFSIRLLLYALKFSVLVFCFNLACTFLTIPFKEGSKAEEIVTTIIFIIFIIILISVTFNHFIHIGYYDGSWNFRWFY